MMTIGEFVRNTAFLLVAMAALSVVETALPFFRRDWRRRHLAPNIQLTAMTLALNFAFNAGAVLLTAWFFEHGYGLFPQLGLAPQVMMLGGVLALDGTTYAAHRLEHAVPFLWRVHSVHHSDPLVDVTTALRFHPIETAWRFAFVVVPAWLLGVPVEAVAVYRIASVFMAIFEHMNVKLWQPLDTALSFVIGTPNMHKLHHSRVATETDTNYGNILSLFDRMFGSFTPSARASSVDCGLDGYDDVETQRLGGLLLLPFRRHEPPEAIHSEPNAPAAGG